MLLASSLTSTCTIQYAVSRQTTVQLLPLPLLQLPLCISFHPFIPPNAPTDMPTMPPTAPPTTLTTKSDPGTMPQHLKQNFTAPSTTHQHKENQLTGPHKGTRRKRSAAQAITKPTTDSNPNSTASSNPIANSVPTNQSEQDLSSLALSHGIPNLHNHIQRQLVTKMGRLRTNRDFQEKYYVCETDEPEGARKGLLRYDI